jgi:RNA polymerase sigma-70 factor
MTVSQGERHAESAEPRLGAMMNPPRLVLIFREYAPGRIDEPANLSEFESLLEYAVEVGRSRWPQFDLPAEVFVRYLAQRLPEATPEKTLKQVLEGLRLADLHLACACVNKVPGADEALEEYCLTKVRLSLKQPDSVVDEICQNLRIQLLLDTPQVGPQIAAYKGKGSLPSWARVIAVNMLLKQANPGPVKTDENVLAALEALPAPGPSTEFELIKRRCYLEFRQALQQAFAALSREQRNLLRFYFVDRLTTTEISELFRVGQPTVSRWLKRTREQIHEETKHRLKERLRLSSQEFESLVEDIMSRFDLSLSQVLEEEEES